MICQYKVFIESKLQVERLILKRGGLNQAYINNFDVFLKKYLNYCAFLMHLCLSTKIQYNCLIPYLNHAVLDFM